LRQVLAKEHQVTVVNASDYFQFVPSNPWLAVGWRNRKQITLPIEPYLKKKNINFIAGWVETIDAQANKLILKDGQEINYDFLVITTGPKLAFDEVEGSGPVKGYTHSVCTVDHAEKAYEDFMKLVDDPGHVIIGAAPFASCFGPAYEYAAIVDTALRKHKVRDRVPMTFVTSEPYIGHLGLGAWGRMPAGRCPVAQGAGAGSRQDLEGPAETVYSWHQRCDCRRATQPSAFSCGA